MLGLCGRNLGTEHCILVYTKFLYQRRGAITSKRQRDESFFIFAHIVRHFNSRQWTVGYVVTITTLQLSINQSSYSAFVFTTEHILQATDVRALQIKKIQRLAQQPLS